MMPWIIGQKTAEEVLKAYLNARFSTDGEFRRLWKLNDMEKRCLSDVDAEGASGVYENLILSSCKSAT
jgi:hypothetical protein